MWRGTLTLLLGGGAAQLGPLLLGPFLARMYGPEVFGLFHLASAIGANIAVVACARYEFALPMAKTEAEARALRSLCVRVLVAVTAVTSLAALAAAGWWQITWPLAVPLMVGALGALSLITLEATRRQRYTALAAARVTQFWGAGALQLALGALQAGLWALLTGPILAAVAAAAALARGASQRSDAGLLDPTARTAQQDVTDRPDWRATARQHRDFPLLNTPHAFLGALQDTLSIALIAACAGPAAAGVWGLALRYLKAPATLAGGAVSQVLYPDLGAQEGATAASREQVRQVMRVLLVCAAALGGAVYTLSAWALPALLGPGWEAAGPLGQALAAYVALHFVASPLGVVTMAWKAQAWALRASVGGQTLFLGALALGLLGHAEREASLQAAGWAVSGVMTVFFGWYFWRLWHWPVARPGTSPVAGEN